MLNHLKKESKSIFLVIVLVWIGVFLYLMSDDRMSVFFILIISLGFGILSGAIVTIYEILFFKLSVPQESKPHKAITTTIVLLTITVANYAFVLFLEQLNFSWNGFLYLMGITILIGALPIFGVTLYQKNRRLTTQLKQTAPVIDHLSGNTPKSSTRWTIKLNKSDSRNINVDCLLYVESKKNYLTFYFEDDRSFQIRFTLKQLEESFSDFDFLIRCHRSFLVNGNKIDSVIPTSNGYNLNLHPGNYSVPVSKTYVDLLKKWASKRRFSF